MAGSERSKKMTDPESYRIITAIWLGSLGGFCKNLMELSDREKLKKRALLISTLTGSVCGVIAYYAGHYYESSFALVGLFSIVGGLMGREFINKITKKVGDKIDTNE